MTSMKVFSKVNTLPTVMGFFLILFFLIANQNRILENIDFFIFDWQSKQLAVTLQADPDIIVIAIDDNSLLRMNAVAGRWVWPRSVHAELLSSLKEHQPLAIVFDILFSEKDIYRPDADLYFNEVLADMDNVYFPILEQNTRKGDGQLLNQFPLELGLQQTALANKTARTSFVLPFAIDKKHWQVGTINFSPSSDGIGRYYDVYRDIDGWKVNSLPAKVIASLGIKLPKAKHILLQWRGDFQHPFKTLSYADVYQASQTNDVAYLKQLNNKIIVIGATASGLFDAKATPLNNTLAGVYMLATAIDNMKNQAYLSFNHEIVQQLITILLLLMIISCFTLFSNYSWQVLISATLLLVSALFLVVTSNYFLTQQKVLFIGSSILMMTLSFLLCAISYGYKEFIQRKKSLALFSRFLDPQVVSRLLNKGELDLHKLNQKRVVTIIFSDIRGFTQLSENREASDVLLLLNQYLSQQVAIIFNHHGTLDKFIGDCIMAFWGAPITNDNHAVDAINAALAMEENLLAFQQQLPASLKKFDIGIGVHSGEAIVGLVGTELRVDYTVIGDAVNLTSRIEGLTKNVNRILVSEQSKNLAEGAFDFEFKGEYTVKGRTSKVRLFQPMRKV
ncbi:MAG: adenylate cyclase [Alteromonadaceae bacterium]|jgi:adenylate cyclase